MTTTPSASAKKLKILAFDDQLENLLILRLILKSAGHTLVERKTGIQAVQDALEHQPDWILLDLLMPDKDGLQVLRELKGNSLTASIPVLVVSGNTDKGLTDQALALGARDFIVKPVEKGSLLQKLLG